MGATGLTFFLERNKDPISARGLGKDPIPTRGLGKNSQQSFQPDQVSCQTFTNHTQNIMQLSVSRYGHVMGMDVSQNTDSFRQQIKVMMTC
jgi:hypothetical protein